MAATVVIGIPELLREIASHIYAPASLNQLCLVSHAFKTAFTPQLYRCLVWHESNIQFLTDPDRRRYLLKDNKLAHTKIFIIARSGVEALHSAWQSGNPRKDVYWRHEDHWYFTGLETLWALLNDVIVEICQHTHGLQTFASQDIAICCGSIAALSSIPSLRNISIEVHEDNNQIVNVDTDATEQSLDKYSNPEEKFTFAALRRLSLLGLWGDLRAWRDQILKIILNSPDLEFLALSISRQVSFDPEDETGRAGPPDLFIKMKMFQWLSREYAKATGRQLEFKSTIFHWGTKISGVIVAEGWSRPDGVEVVYIWNEDNMPFLNGLEVFPMLEIGPQLFDTDES